MSELDKIKRWIENDVKSHKTVETYMATIREFDKKYGIDNLDETTVAEYLLEDKGHLKNTSKARHLYALKKAEKPLLLYNIIDDEVNWERVPSIEQNFRKEPKYLSKEQIQKLFDVAERYRDKAMIYLGYDLALRVSELANLKHTQIDLNNAKVHLDRAKGGDKKVWSISNKTVEAVKGFLENGETVGDDTLFEIGTKRLNECFRALGEKVGLVQKNKRFGLHLLRHSRATHLADRGWDVESIRVFLGQASISSTEKYIHAAPDKLESMKKEADEEMLT